MKNTLFMVTLLFAGMTIAMPHANAETATAGPKKEAAKKPVKKVAKKAVKKAAAAESASADDSEHPDLADARRTNFNCELGNRIAVYEKVSDKDSIQLRWKKRVHDLKRVATTTGANRFEDKEAGLVWIHIPAKAMLLDSKKGQQLANECRSPEQMVAFKAKS